MVSRGMKRFPSPGSAKGCASRVSARIACSRRKTEKERDKAENDEEEEEGRTDRLDQTILPEGGGFVGGGCSSPNAHGLLQCGDSKGGLMLKAGGEFSTA